MYEWPLAQQSALHASEAIRIACVEKCSSTAITRVGVEPGASASRNKLDATQRQRALDVSAAGRRRIPGNATVLNYWSYESAQAAPQVNNVNTAGQLAEYSDAGTGSITVYREIEARRLTRTINVITLDTARANKN
jgi:hypothetical protein